MQRSDHPISHIKTKAPKILFSAETELSETLLAPGQVVYLTSQRVLPGPSRVSDSSVSAETVVYEREEKNLWWGNQGGAFLLAFKGKGKGKGKGIVEMHGRMESLL